ncbi:MAG: methylated-DNA--[protein]-cysteine S-methyltransferase [Deltaproteobacteria bacterium]|nr:methylated-DNA--[protein]-cysteine S-methyltransferase [Deltaproteobacteria bacterium]
MKTTTDVRACLFPSPIGTCGLAWTKAGIRLVQLPEEDEKATASRLARRAEVRQLEASPSREIAAAISRLQRLLGGEDELLADLPLDLAPAGPFLDRVYAEARRLRPGETVSYGELARRAGSPGAARAVGQAMAKNPVPLLIPCHRVLAGDGGLGWFSAHGDVSTKLALLSIEGLDLTALHRAGLRHLRRADPRLGELIRRVGPCRLKPDPRGDAFTALVESIVHQQLSIKAGATIFRRILDAAGAVERLDPAAILGLDAERLRSAGLSRQKVSYVRDLAEQAAAGALPFQRLRRASDDEVVRALTSVRGIGRWSAEMFLIFRMGRLNVLPTDDLGLQTAVKQVYGLKQRPERARLERLGASWAPYRTLATWYLWRSLEA